MCRMQLATKYTQCMSVLLIMLIIYVVNDYCKTPIDTCVLTLLCLNYL